MTNIIVNEDQEIFSSFVAETTEMLDNVEPKIVEMQGKALTEAEYDPEIVNSIFRLFHTLKGSAGFLELGNLEAVTHEAENLLDLYRKGKADITNEHMDLIFKTCDFIRKTLVHIEEYANDKGFELEVKDIIQDYSELSLPPKKPEESTSKFVSKYSAKIANIFMVEAESLVNALNYELTKLEIDTNDQNTIETISSYLKLLKNRSKELEYHDLVLVLSKVEDYFSNCKSGQIINYKENVTFIIKIIELVEEGLQKIKLQNPDYMISSMGLMAFIDEMILESKNKKGSKSPQVDEITIPDEPDELSYTLKEDFISEITAPVAEISDMSIPKDDIVTNLLAEANIIEGMNLQKTITDIKAIKEIKKTPDNFISLSKNSIKVDLDKVDKLVNWVGELAIAESMVVQNQQIKDLDDSTLDNSIYNLHRIISEIQYVAMSLRMVPVENTFKKMIRLVNELSRKAGKTIHLNIEGEDTELDKSVVEALNDPLIHLLRNAIDHGIEDANARKEAKKSEIGIINLKAIQEGGEIHIVIQDDGRGLNKDKILKKALENGLIKETDTLKDNEIYNIIFEAGFSTADKITEVSGRGVGMDVVRRNIEKIKGNIDINTTLGVGTTITLRIPLTMAIMEGMLVQIGSNYYTLPLLIVKELFQPLPEMITQTPDGMEMAKVRDLLIPVIRLHKMYGITPLNHQLEAGILITVESRSGQFCLHVDNIIGQQQAVIKALPDYLDNIQGVSGCTILGNGEISPIVDLNGILNKLKNLDII